MSKTSKISTSQVSKYEKKIVSDLAVWPLAGGGGGDTIWG